MKDMDEKSELFIQSKANIGYLDITWTVGAVDIVQKKEGKQRLK